MKVALDLTTHEIDNVGYLSLCSIEAGGVKRTVTVEESILLDFDEEGALLGIEFLDAKTALARLEKDDE